MNNYATNKVRSRESIRSRQTKAQNLELQYTREVSQSEESGKEGSRKKREERKEEEFNKSTIRSLLSSKKILPILIILILLFGLNWYSRLTATCNKTDNKFNKEDIKIILSDLKKQFPTQLNETWKFISSVLFDEGEWPRSLFMLIDDDSTCNCLQNKLFQIYKKKLCESADTIDFLDNLPAPDIEYGAALLHYQGLMEKDIVLIADLNKIPGKLIRVFHSLCDDIHKDKKSPLFLFTLKNKNGNTKEKPRRLAEGMLIDLWHELEENELYPLISRITGNTIYVRPEENNICS